MNKDDFEITVVLPDDPIPMPDTPTKMSAAIMGTFTHLGENALDDTTSDFGGYADELLKVSSNLIPEPVYISVIPSLNKEGEEIIPPQEDLKLVFLKKQADNTLVPNSPELTKVLKDVEKEAEALTSALRGTIKKKLKKAQEYADRIVPINKNKPNSPAHSKAVKVKVKMPKALAAVKKQKAKGSKRKK